MLVSLGALCTMLGASRSARAELQVHRSEGADSCPDTLSFAGRMRDGSVDAAARASASASDIIVRFEHTASGYRSSVIMPDGKRRSLTDDAPTCEGLAEATVLAVKLALDLETAPADTDVGPAASAVVRPALSPPDVATPPPHDPSAGRTSTVAEISASGVLAFGLGSPAAPGARGGAALVLGEGRWSIGMTGLVLPAQTREIGDGAVDVSILGGGVEGCGRVPVGGRALLFALCGRIEAMSLRGSSRGFARTEDHARPLFAGTLLARARARVAGPLSGFVEAAAVVPFVRDRFAIDTVGVVYDPPVVAAATGIGVVVDFE